MSEAIVPNNGHVDTREFVARPKVRILSRGTQIDRQKILDNVGGQQAHMIHVAARMTRRILAERRKEEIDPYVTPVDALLELEKGPIDITDYIMIPPNREWVDRWYASKANSVTWNI